MKKYNRKEFINIGGIALTSLLTNSAYSKDSNNKRIGIIGLDTSHAIAFTKTLYNNPDEYNHFKVVAAYPYGTKTIESATKRIPKYVEEIKLYDVKITESIKSLLEQVDYILLETNDGRLHLEQAEEVFKAGKPIFIDKPIATSYKDAKRIFELSKKYNAPCFSSSSLRYIDGLNDVIDGKYGKVLGADVYTPAIIEPSHPDFYWYGIHGVEMLFAAMGTGCVSIARSHTKDTDILVGTWDDNRIGVVRGKRNGIDGFGGIVYCEKANVKLGEFKDYTQLLKEIIKFFETKTAPFDYQQTLEICAFIDAADESKKYKGKRVNLIK